jgi:tight adherence protein B
MGSNCRTAISTRHIRCEGDKVVSELWIITLLVFIAALFGILAVHGLTFGARETNNAITRRLASRQSTRSQTEALDALRRRRGIVDDDLPLLKHFNQWLTQTGLRIEWSWLLLYAFAIGMALFVGFGLVFAFGFASFLAAMISAPLIMLMYFRTMRRRRIDRFSEQLPEAIEIIVRGIRVGYPLSVAFGLVAREMPDPIGPEFGMTADEISFGQNIHAATENLFRRVGQDDLQLLIVAVNIQTQTGGNLAEVLLRLSRLIRSRAKIAQRIRALSAEGRIAAKFLSAMPFVMVGVISVISPTFFTEVRHSEAIGPALIYAAASLIVGNIMMYRMVNFKF